VPAHEVEQVRDHVTSHVLAHEGVLMTVPREHLELVLVAAELSQPPVALDVGIGEDVVGLSGGEQHRRLDLARVLEVVVR
jgi:ABC-type transport system involved in cytochrome bd biosynthesis fused ATPase/permease subunit